MSVDGFMADKNGRTDWMIWNWGADWTWDEELRKYFNDVTASLDCILLSRKMAEEGYIHHWAKRAQETDNPQSVFAGKITGTRKIVFTKTLQKSEWDRTVLAKGDLNDEINKLKKSMSGILIAYGGVSFASSLLKSGLVDELHCIINPSVICKGFSPFSKNRLNLSLVKATAYPCGIVVSKYTMK